MEEEKRKKAPYAKQTHNFLILSVRRQFYRHMFAPEPHSTREDPFAVICTSTKEEARGGKGSSLAIIEIITLVFKICSLMLH